MNVPETVARPATLAPTSADRHPVALYLAGLAPGSRRSQLAALDTIAAILTAGAVVRALDLPGPAWGALRAQHAQAVRAALADRYAPATANRHLSALRAVLREAWRVGYMSAEDRARAEDVAPVRGSRLPAGREVTGGEVVALFAACEADASPAGVRDASMLALMVAGGLRRAEVVALTVGDVQLDPDAGRVRVLGKGNKEREVCVANGALAALADWLAVRGPEAGALYCPINKAGRVMLRAMTTQAVYAMARARAAEAGVAHFSPHDLRRTCAGHLIERADISTAQQILGHASVTTTQRYDRRGAAVRARAAGLLHTPYRSRVAS